MKKYILILILILFIVPYNTYAVSNVDYTIPSISIESYVNNDGSMDVCEYIVQKGSFNGYERDIVVANDNEMISASGISDIKVYEFDVTNKVVIGDFEKVLYASKGDKLKYTISNAGDAKRITMYNAMSSGSRGYKVCYTLDDVAVVYQDVAEIYWNFIGNANTLRFCGQQYIGQPYHTLLLSSHKVSHQKFQFQCLILVPL